MKETSKIPKRFRKSKILGNKRNARRQSKPASAFCNHCRFIRPMYVGEVIAKMFGTQTTYQAPDLTRFISSRIEQIRNIRKYYEKLETA
ncbi:MAG: hypothetical protein RMJ97_11335 [Raineya sp.]|nr:hypothetical protein [Raineya sp.]